MKPLITVGIPVYNGLPYLPDALQSVLQQTYRHFEVLVVDDGSTDDSLSYLQKVRDPRLRVISQPHNGLTAALNRLLAEARTPWLVRMDADDIAHPDRLAVTADAIKQRPAAGMFYTSGSHYGHPCVISKIRMTQGTPEELRAVTQAGYLLAICHATTALNVAKTLDLGGYRFDLFVEDLDLWWRMALRHDIVYLPQTTFHYRLRQGGSCVRNLKALSTNTLYIQYLLLSNLRQISPLPYETVLPHLEGMVNDQQLQYRHQMWIAGSRLSSREYCRAVPPVLKAFVKSPRHFLERLRYPVFPPDMFKLGVDPLCFEDNRNLLWGADRPTGRTDLRVFHPQARTTISTPLVTAVIPTRNRPQLLLRAVESALQQTYRNLEVVVVIDGSDPATTTALETIKDERLRVLALEQSVGGSDARNLGVQHARGEWIAFLDDDDEWLPHKIDEQIHAAMASSHSSPLICSQCLVKTPLADFIWPETPPRKPYSEYLLARSRLSYGEGMMPTPVLMVKRELAQRIPFRSGLRKHQDWDWVLRCTELYQTPVIFLPTPLAIVHYEESHPRITTRNMWRVSLEWIRQSKGFVTRRAYAAFLANFAATQAADEKAWEAFFILFGEMLAHGSPRIRELGVFMGAWLVPRRWRAALRTFVHARAAHRKVGAPQPPAFPGAVWEPSAEE